MNGDITVHQTQSEDCAAKLKQTQAELTEAYKFLEYTEAMTVDTSSQRKIRNFLYEKGVWTKSEKI